ncbi:MAG TPA: farnesyl diphosphate synthase [Acidobacteriaceae bacterium]|nr:farnesyl diphosphate synthase [Acidobacteriaceae bacterium]
MNSEVQDILTSGVTLTDAALERLLPSATTEPHSIHRAMRHSTFAGGKRLRPILCMEAARMVAGTGQIPPGAADLGAAIEMAHTYSLIHDDLPALDNDDLRRGQPTCHVAFGEAIAILAGDALQNLSFQVISNLPAPPATIVAILHDFALAIGTGVGAPTALPPGMIGGQVVDIESEHHKPTPELVERIHRAKTGALITTSIVCGGLLGLATNPGAPGLDSETWVSTDLSHTDILARLRTFGQSAGLAFQIVDDILDMTQTSAELGKTAGKDTASDKATWPAVYGIEQSKKDAANLIADADHALAPFGDAANPLMSLARYLVDRTH